MSSRRSERQSLSRKSAVHDTECEAKNEQPSQPTVAVSDIPFVDNAQETTTESWEDTVLTEESWHNTSDDGKGIAKPYDVCRVCRKLNKFWMITCGCRCRFFGITTVSVGEFFFWLWAFVLFAWSLYLVGGYSGYPNNKMPVYGDYTLHSGITTGMFYVMVISLSRKWVLYPIAFDRQMIYHRKCASLGAICCIFHIFDHREVLTTWKALTGWISYGAAVLLLVTANNYFRRNHYNGFFIRSHWLFIVVFLVFGWLHDAIAIKIGTIFIVVDSIIRIIDLRFRTTKITNIHFLDYDRVIKLEFEKKYFRYNPGQYVFIRIPAIGMLEFHPFSISSYPGSGRTFSVHIKASVASEKGWTSRLSKFMKEHENEPEKYKNISVQIEGPFGELTLPKELTKYEHVVFIAGGIGITPLHSQYNQLVTDLLDNKISHKVKTRKIDLVFTTRSRSLITEFASRNKAWEFYSKQTWDLSTTQYGSDDDNVSIKSLTLNLPAKPIPNDLMSDSLRVSSLDRTVCDSLPTRMSFNRSNSPKNNLTEFSEDRISNLKTTHAKSLAVESLEILNSTHITRVKGPIRRRQYRETYPFINFKRPNIRGIIYAAASNTISKDMCVLTSGPKEMMNECKLWAAEIGVDIHCEHYNW